MELSYIKEELGNTVEIDTINIGILKAFKIVLTFGIKFTIIAIYRLHCVNKVKFNDDLETYIKSLKRKKTLF